MEQRPQVCGRWCKCIICNDEPCGVNHSQKTEVMKYIYNPTPVNACLFVYSTLPGLIKLPLVCACDAQQCSTIIQMGIGISPLLWK